MIRSSHVLAAAVCLLGLASSCLGMLVTQCPDCLPWLRIAVAGGMTIAALAAIALFLLTLWHTQRLWRLCQLHAVPPPPKVQQVCQRLGLSSDEVVCSDQLGVFSFCIGLFCPRIVVSTGLVQQVSTRELAAILAHERHHQQRRDPLRLLVMRFIRPFLYPLPAVHDFYRSFLALVEIEADEVAVAASGRPALAGALHKLLSLPTQQHPSLLLSAITRFSAQQSRVDRLLDPHRAPALPLSMPRLLVSLAPFLLFCLTMFIN